MGRRSRPIRRAPRSSAAIARWPIDLVIQTPSLPTGTKPLDVLHSENFAVRGRADATLPPGGARCRENSVNDRILIATHNDPAATHRLITRLRPHDVYVHLDAKTKEGPEWNAVRPYMVAERHPV